VPPPAPAAPPAEPAPPPAPPAPPQPPASQPTVAAVPAVEGALVYTDGADAGKRIPVTSEVTLGRENVDVVVDDDLVSRRHATVRPVPGGLEISDLGSSNGTYVNKTRIQGTQVLKDGDTIHLGRVSFVVQLSPRGS
jgi:pSer/pThr/pTyr-binding forkhead associated (FHA) protein